MEIPSNGLGDAIVALAELPDDVTLHLHSDVNATIKLVITAE